MFDIDTNITTIGYYRLTIRFNKNRAREQKEDENVNTLKMRNKPVGIHNNGWTMERIIGKKFFNKINRCIEKTLFEITFQFLRCLKIRFSSRMGLKSREFTLISFNGLFSGRWAIFRSILIPDFANARIRISSTIIGRLGRTKPN